MRSPLVRRSTLTAALRSEKIRRARGGRAVAAKIGGLRARLDVAVAERDLAQMAMVRERNARRRAERVADSFRSFVTSATSWQAQQGPAMDTYDVRFIVQRPLVDETTEDAWNKAVDQVAREVAAAIVSGVRAKSRTLNLQVRVSP